MKRSIYPVYYIILETRHDGLRALCVLFCSGQQRGDGFGT